jgi:hypothetical protein
MDDNFKNLDIIRHVMYILNTNRFTSCLIMYIYIINECIIFIYIKYYGILILYRCSNVTFSYKNEIYNVYV